MAALATAKADSDRKLQSVQVEARLLRHRLGLSGGAKASDLETGTAPPTEVSGKVAAEETLTGKLPDFVALANSKARVASLKAENRVLKTRLARMLQVGSMSRQGSVASLASPVVKLRSLG